MMDEGAVYSKASNLQVTFNNPVIMKSLINKKVEVKCKSNSREVVGTVYTIDPVSQMIALMEENESTGCIDMHLILGQYCESVKLIGPSDFTIDHDLFYKEEEFLNEEEKTNRRKKLMSWLKSNMIPVIEDGDVIKVGQVLTIDPPYNSYNCLSDSEIVLKKIQNLISNINEQV